MNQKQQLRNQDPRLL